MALIAVTHYSHAVDYYVDVVLPKTGGTTVQNSKYSQMAASALQAASDITSTWSGDQLIVTVKDNANDGATSLSQVYESSQASPARVAVIGAGADDVTRSAAQLLKYFGVRLSCAPPPPSLVMAPLTRHPTQHRPKDLLPIGRLL